LRQFWVITEVVGDPGIVLGTNYVACSALLLLTFPRETLASILKSTELFSKSTEIGCFKKHHS
jgi:hypothetical protein